MIEDEGAVLCGGEAALRGDIASGGVDGVVDLAVVEDGFAVAVDEVDVAGDEAVGDVGTGGDRDAGGRSGRGGRGVGGGGAGWGWGSGGQAGGGGGRAEVAGLAAALGSDVEGVLIAEDVNVGEDVAVAFDVEGLCLRAGAGLLVGAVEVVLEGDVLGVEVVAEDVNGGVAGFGAAGALAGVIDDDGFGGVGVGADEGYVGLLDDDLLAVGAGGEGDDAAFGGELVDRGLGRW